MDDEQRGAAGPPPQVPNDSDVSFEELYGSSYERIYDFALRLAQDRDTAALVVQSTFLRAYRVLRGGQQVPDLDLYASAHHDTVERLSGRRGTPEQPEEPYAVIDASRLSMPVEDTVEAGRMVWAAAVDLKLNDYELLDLRFRQQLDASEVATVLRARPESVERKLIDAQSAFERGFTARLLFTKGRRECLDLDFQIGDTEWSNSLSRRVLQHAEACQVCRTTREMSPPATDLLSALMPVPAPAGWKETILERLQEAVRQEPIPTPTPAAAREAAPDAASAAAQAAAGEPSPAPQRPLRPLPEYGGGGSGGSIADWLESVLGVVGRAGRSWQRCWVACSRLWS